MSMELDKHINECALNLNDGRLLAYFVGGNIVAKGLKYHIDCLTFLHNRERANLATTGKHERDKIKREMDVYPLVS